MIVLFAVINLTKSEADHSPNLEFGNARRLSST
jgi:hypothetical protein